MLAEPLYIVHSITLDEDESEIMGQKLLTSRDEDLFAEIISGMHSDVVITRDKDLKFVIRVESDFYDDITYKHIEGEIKRICADLQDFLNE